MWLRIRISGGLLWTGQWTFKFHNILEIWCVAEQLLASKDGVISTELVSSLIGGCKVQLFNLRISKKVEWVILTNYSTWLYVSDATSTAQKDTFILTKQIHDNQAPYPRHRDPWSAY
jgi:hypothetical protein